MDIRSLAAPALAGTTATPAPTAADGATGFGQFLTDAVASLEQTRADADTLTGALASGQNVDLHQVMLAVEQANLATQLTMQVRNKLVEAYQEVSRMQV